MERHVKRALDEFRLSLHTAMDQLERALSQAPATPIQRARDAKSLETWALSSRLLEMKRNKLSQVQMAAQTGYSKPHICWLLKARENLDASILQAWSEGHPRANQHNLNRLSALSHNEQKREWPKLASAKRGVRFSEG